MIVIGITQIGKSHIEDQTVCQDHVEVVSKENLISICVSDGAGSKPQSHLASQFVVKRMIEAIEEHFDEWYDHIKYEQFAKLFESWFDNQFIKEVERLNKGKSDEEMLTHKDLLATLVFYAEKDKKGFFIHVGDGVIVGLNRDYVMDIVSFPENGEFSNVTYFITTPKNHEHIRSQIVEPDKYLALFCMSDGGEDIYIDKQNDRVIKGLHYVVLDAVKNRDTFLTEFKTFLAKQTPSSLKDDIGIAMIIKDEQIDHVRLEKTYQDMPVPVQNKEKETKHFRLTSQVKEPSITEQGQRDRSNALNPKHYAYYVSRGYSKDEAITKAKEHKGFVKSPMQKAQERKSIVHVCDRCLSENIEKIRVYVKDEHDVFLGEYAAKKCKDCGEVTILYKINIAK